MIKCSKCGSLPGSYVETLDAVICYDADENGFPINGDYFEPGNPRYLEVKCLKCDHIWRTRKSIIDLKQMKDELTTQRRIKNANRKKDYHGRIQTWPENKTVQTY